MIRWVSSWLNPPADNPPEHRKADGAVVGFGCMNTSEKEEGPCKKIWPDGTTFTGEMQNGQKVSGYLETKGASVIGTFLNDKPDKICRIQSADGTWFEGKLQEGKLLSGIFKNADGDLSYVWFDGTCSWEDIFHGGFPEPVREQKMFCKHQVDALVASATEDANAQIQRMREQLVSLQREIATLEAQQSSLQIHGYVCPITGQVCADPVEASDGFIYEREAIEKWYHEEKTSPFTRERLTGVWKPVPAPSENLVSPGSSNGGGASSRTAHSLRSPSQEPPLTRARSPSRGRSRSPAHGRSRSPARGRSRSHSPDPLGR